MLGVRLLGLCRTLRTLPALRSSYASSLSRAGLPNSFGQSMLAASTMAGPDGLSFDPKHPLASDTGLPTRWTPRTGRPSDPSIWEARGKDSAKPYEVFVRPFNQSPNDKRGYRLIRLENDLHAWVISDPETDKAAVSCVVSVGYFQDTLPGIAHAVEHVSFMGTKEYPDPASYAESIGDKGGETNAYTSTDRTNYYFSVNAPSLAETVDHFSTFFKSPIFAADAIEKEMLAVDSEFTNQKQDDGWKLQELRNSLSRPDHPLHLWGTGSYASLYTEPKSKGLEPRTLFVDWWKKHYSANLMTVAIYGQENLDELTKLAVDKFSAVENKNMPLAVVSSNAWSEDQKACQITSKTVKDARTLEVWFMAPDMHHFLADGPADFITSLIGHEGQGSLLSHLKKLGLADSLSAGGYGNARGISCFAVSVDLTKKGLKENRQVALQIFAYINMLKANGLPQSHFDELKRLREIEFRFSEKSPNPVRDVMFMAGTTGRQGVPFERMLDLSLPQEWHSDAMAKFLDLLDPSQARLVLAAKDFGLEPPVFDRMETRLETPYRIDALGPDFIEEARTILPPAEVHLPPPNIYIPEHLKVIGSKAAEPSERPNLIRQSKSLTVWHKQDDRWLVPNANVHIRLSAPEVGSSAQAWVETALVIRLLTDNLTERLYDAEVAGLHLSVSRSEDAVRIALSGYSEKISTILGTLLHDLQSVVFTQERFEIILDQYIQILNQQDTENPYISLRTVKTETLEKGHMHMTTDIKKQIAQELSLAQLQARLKTIIDSFHTTVFAHGNLSETEAQGLSDMIGSILRPAEMPLPPVNRMLIPEAGKDLVITGMSRNPDDVNSAVNSHYHIGSDADKQLITKIRLMGSIIGDPIFDQLRTKEQLGYIVWANPSIGSGAAGFAIQVQSPHCAAYVDSRIEAFIQPLIESIKAMSDETFQTKKDGYIKDVLRKDQNLGAESKRYWTAISNGEFDFHAAKNAAAYAENITRLDIVAFMEKYLLQGSPDRCRISFRWQSTKNTSRTLSPEAVEALRQFAVTKELLSDEAASAFTAQAMTVEQIRGLIEGSGALGKNQLLAKLDELAESAIDIMPGPDTRQMMYGSDEWKAFVQSLPVAPQPVPVEVFEPKL